MIKRIVVHDEKEAKSFGWDRYLMRKCSQVEEIRRLVNEIRYPSPIILAS